MLMKQIVIADKPCIVACDAKCERAFGMNLRPTVQGNPNEKDGLWYLSDEEVGDAPIEPGSIKGGFYGKPKTPLERLNKWCVRECERKVLVDIGKEPEIRDFSQRVRA